MAEKNIGGQSLGAAPQQATKTKRDIALERVRSRHPDSQYADDDDEALYGAINDDYDADQKELSEYKTHEKALSDMMTADPMAASFLQSMRKGANPWTELVRRYGEDAIDYFTDPDNADEIGQAQADYLKKVSQEHDLEEEYEKNMKSSLSLFEKMDAEFGEETTNRLIGKLFSVANDVIKGKFTKEVFDMFRLAETHDEDVANAAHEAEVRGKNNKHVEQLRLRQKGDGTASLSSASESGNQGGGEPDYGAIGKMARRGNIWDKANEKRISRQQ